MASETRCSACFAEAVSDGVCGRCGFATGEAQRCPHCGSVARALPRDGGARWVCGVCGGPRVYGGFGGAATTAPLREERAHRARATRARVASWIWTMTAVFAAFVALVAWPASLVAKAILAMFVLAPTLFAVLARARRSRAMESALAASDRAWVAAAADVASREGAGITASELAPRLRVPLPRAEQLLSELAVLPRTRIDVGDDAEVRYSVAPEPTDAEVEAAHAEEAAHAGEAPPAPPRTAR